MVTTMDSSPTATTAPTPTLADLRLWQLISPTLPVGGYSYSQGLECAVQMRWVSDESSLADWLVGYAESSLCALELPLLLRVHGALMAADVAGAANWGAHLASARETSELRREDHDMAMALRRLLRTLAPEFSPPPGPAAKSYIAVFAAISAHWAIPARAAAAGYVWSWAENMIAAATRLMPLGQSAAQRLLFDLAGQCETWVKQAELCRDADIGFTGPGFMIASAAHETQYSRLFRS